MTESRSEAGAVRYYCTAGNGMEVFLMEEVKKKLAAEDVCRMPGKVLFSSSASVDRIRELKAAERLFLLLKEDSPLRLSAHTSPAKAVSMLQSKLLGDKNLWISAVMTWSRLQGELASSKTAAKASSPSLGVTVKKEGTQGKGAGSEEWEKCIFESGKGEGEEESGREGRGSGGQTGKQTLGRKRRRGEDDEEEEERRGSAVDSEVQNAEKSRISQEVETRMVEEISSRRKTGKHGSDEESDSEPPAAELQGSSMKDSTVGSVNSVSTAEKGKAAPLEACRSKAQLPSAPSFRISCKCAGSLSRCLSSQEVSKVLGVGLSRLLGWRVDLRNPALEVNVNLSDDHCLLGIPLTRTPLANRAYIKSTGLRSTVAWAMASLAHIQAGFCVVDPMCGVGTILIEAAQEHKDACFLGMDIDHGQLQKAGHNAAFAELGNRIHLLRASSMALPLPSASVHAVICDLPFGRKFGTRADMAANLPLVLAEMERVLSPGGVLVLLLSPQLSCVLKKLLIQKDAGPTADQETKLHSGIQHCTDSAASPRPPHTQTELLPALSSLQHQATFRVSLGAIDGLIHKYVKTGS